MKCPHCLVMFHSSWQNSNLPEDVAHYSHVQHTLCPNCYRLVVLFVQRPKSTPSKPNPEPRQRLIHPKTVSRSPLPASVPVAFSEDYVEACNVLPDSAKASAALSRRCLQNLLREQAKVGSSDLDMEITELLAQKSLPPSLADAVDAVRVVGNFAAHPIKSKSTGEVVQVEPGEAEWLLDVIEGLFGYYFVQPDELQKKRDALNKKLQDAGKPLLKGS